MLGLNRNTDHVPVGQPLMPQGWYEPYDYRRNRHGALCGYQVVLGDSHM